MAAKPYDRLPEESNPAYEAFAIYRDMGTGRSTDAVVQRTGKNRALIHRWSSENSWVARVRAYDEYVDTQARQKAERDAINRRAEMLKRHALTGKVLQQKGIEYIDKHGMDKSSDAITAIAKGIDIERKTEGLPEYMMEIVNADDNELARRYAELLAEIGGTGSGDEAAGDAAAGTDAAETPTETHD